MNQFYRPWPPSDITLFSRMYEFTNFWCFRLGLAFFTPGVILFSINFTLKCHIIDVFIFAITKVVEHDICSKGKSHKFLGGLRELGRKLVQNGWLSVTVSMC